MGSHLFLATKIGCTAETLRRRVRQAERDSGERDGATTAERERIEALEQRYGNRARPTRFRARHRLVLPGRSSTARSGDERVRRRAPRRLRGRADPQSVAGRPVDILPARGPPDRSWPKVGPSPARWAPARANPAGRERPFPSLWCPQDLAPIAARRRQCGPLHGGAADATGEGLRGVVRGKPVKTTVGDPATPCPPDRAHRQFQADRPNALWASDFTYASTGQGFVCVAFVADVFARRIVGWKVSGSARTDFVPDALEQALHARPPVGQEGLVHHGDRGVQRVSIRYTERLAEAGIEPSVGSVGDSRDSALAETINGLYKAEVIHRQSRKNREAAELATLTWVDRFNHRRLLAPIGNIPPAEAEEVYYRQMNEFAIAT